jgi:putative ABC transport system permease protein
LLSLCGGIVGILLAIWGVDLLKTIGAQTVPRLREVNLDLTVLAITFLVSVGTGIVFGMVPGLASGKPELTEALKEGGRGSTEGRRRNRLRNALVVGEVALALVLLTSAGLLMKSFVRLQNVNPGFNPHNVLTMEISLPKLKYNSNEAAVQFTDEAHRRITTIPGVRSAAFTTILPLSGTNSDSSFTIEGKSNGPNDPFPDEEYREVSPDYFRVLETLLLQGRFFTAADNATAPLVIIVNQTFAKKFWPNESAVGKRITFDDPKKNPKWVTIVGVAGDIRHLALDLDAKPEMYVPWAQDPYTTAILAVRTAQDPRSVISAIRREVQAIDPAQPIANIRTLETVISDSIAPRRLSVVMFGVFAGIALLLASVGIYGVMSFLVVQRTHEIGVRMALGAQRTDVLRLIVGHALRLVIIGTVFGLLIAIFSTRALASLLYDVSAFDKPTFVLVTFVLGGVALAASYVPALRAMRADPMIALGRG